MIDDAEEYIVVDYDEGTSLILYGWDVEKEVDLIRSCGNKAIVRKVYYGDTIIDDSVNKERNK